MFMINFFDEINIERYCYLEELKYGAAIRAAPH